jgi:bifunctional DNA-binding transcriptional regulator/antitoxin component of YhaV-PrlF toxin-antitoxin module
METSEEATAKRWTLPVGEDGILVLPDELWNALGWKEGDELEWLDQEDGTFLLVKEESSEKVET